METMTIDQVKEALGEIIDEIWKGSKALHEKEGFIKLERGFAVGLLAHQAIIRSCFFRIRLFLCLALTCLSTLVTFGLACCHSEIVCDFC